LGGWLFAETMNPPGISKKVEPYAQVAGPSPADGNVMWANCWGCSGKPSVRCHLRGSTRGCLPETWQAFVQCSRPTWSLWVFKRKTASSEEGGYFATSIG
jgi:hypothetical protein